MAEEDKPIGGLAEAAEDFKKLAKDVKSIKIWDASLSEVKKINAIITIPVFILLVIFLFSLTIDSVILDFIVGIGCIGIYVILIAKAILPLE